MMRLKAQMRVMIIEFAHRACGARLLVPHRKPGTGANGHKRLAPLMMNLAGVQWKSSSVDENRTVHRR